VIRIRRLNEQCPACFAKPEERCSTIFEGGLVSRALHMIVDPSVTEISIENRALSSGALKR
jgi:hypothetical protein